jgi:hypothetical protein
MKKEETISLRCEIKETGTSRKDAFKCIGGNEARNLFSTIFFVIFVSVFGSCDRASWAKCEEREKTKKMQQLDVYY